MGLKNDQPGSYTETSNKSGQEQACPTESCFLLSKPENENQYPARWQALLVTVSLGLTTFCVALVSHLLCTLNFGQSNDILLSFSLGWNHSCHCDSPNHGPVSLPVGRGMVHQLVHFFLDSDADDVGQTVHDVSRQMGVLFESMYFWNWVAYLRNRTFVFRSNHGSVHLRTGGWGSERWGHCDHHKYYSSTDQADLSGTIRVYPGGGEYKWTFVSFCALLQMFFWFMTRSHVGLTLGWWNE